MQRFQALGIDWAVLPYRTYGEGTKSQQHFVALKLSRGRGRAGGDVCVRRSGQSTDSELRAWGVAHAPLWAALRARTFAVHVVTVGTGAEAVDRAAAVVPAAEIVRIILTRLCSGGVSQGECSCLARTCGRQGRL